MNVVLLLAVAIAGASIWGAAYLLRVWHEDRAHMIASGEPVTLLRTWPFSRVLAYVAISCTLASTYLGWLTIARLLNLSVLGLTNEQMRVELTPFTLAALLVLDAAFVVIALYLRVIRSRVP